MTEQAVHRRGYADPRVADVDSQLPALSLVATPRRELLAADCQDDLAPFRELHRIRQEVEEDLTEPTDVADQGDRHRVVDRVDKLELLARGGGSDDVERGLDGVANDEGVRVELDPTASISRKSRTSLMIVRARHPTSGRLESRRSPSRPVSSRLLILMIALSGVWVLLIAARKPFRLVGPVQLSAVPPAHRRKGARSRWLRRPAWGGQSDPPE
jgi:hypothetical protein